MQSPHTSKKSKSGKPEVKAMTRASMAEEGQENPVEVAFAAYNSANDQLVQCHSFVHCRDFLGDALVAQEEGKPRSIYGFSYTPGKNPQIDVEYTSLLVDFKTKDRLDNFYVNVKILNDIEDTMKINGGTFFEVVPYGDKSNVAWVLGSEFWQQTTVNISLYTYLIKCLSEKLDPDKWMQQIKALKSNGYSTHEAGYMDPDYLTKLFPRLKEITEFYKTVSGFKDQKNVSTGTIHHSSGFIAMKPLLLNKAKKADCAHVLTDFKGL